MRNVTRLPPVSVHVRLDALEHAVDGLHLLVGEDCLDGRIRQGLAHGAKGLEHLISPAATG